MRAILPSLLCTTLAFAALAASAAESRWRLATSDTELTVDVANQRPRVVSLRHPALPHNWAGAGIEFPLLQAGAVDGQDSQFDWRFSQAGMDRATQTLTLLFTNARPALNLRSRWRARPGHGPVEHWIELQNLDPRPVMVRQQESLALRGLRVAAASEVWWVRRGGGNASTQGGTFTERLNASTRLDLVSNCEDGASPVPWLAVQTGGQQGLYLGWEFSGLGRIQAVGGSDGSTLDLAVGNMPDFQTDIEPGQTLLVPPAFVGCYQGDIDDGSYTLHRFVLEHLRPPVPRDLPDPVLAYNLYLDAGGASATEADVLRSAGFCAQLGFEVFMPDAMWFPATGDWRWDPKRFPRGVVPIERFVHAQGMKLALWCAWSNGGVSDHPTALSVRGPVGHPDWFNSDYPASWQPGPFYGGQICLGCPAAREWAVRKTQWLVSEHRLEYLKHDIGPIVTHCNKTTHRHHYGTDASYWAALGYYEVQEKLRQAHPNLLLENCSGGGHIKDFGAVARTHYTVTTDTLSNLPDRQSIYDSTFVLPPLVLQAYTYDNFYPVKGDEPGPFLWTSAMMSAWQIDPTDTATWTDYQREAAKRAVHLYKQWVRPMLADVKVHHILPRPDGTNWDGMFYWSPPLKRGTLYVFRPDTPEESKTIRLKGLEAGESYWVWSEAGELIPGLHSGEELMSTGLTATLRRRYESDLICLQLAGAAKPKHFAAPGEFRLGQATPQSDPFSVSVHFTWQGSRNARSYRVTVSDSPDFGRVLAEQTTFKLDAALEGLPAATPLFWSVTASSPGGKRSARGSPGAFNTPRLRSLPGVVFVSDLPWARATAGANNTVHRDTNYYGKPITIAHRAYPKGIWTHAFADATPADLVVDVQGRGFAAFVAEVGVEDAAGGGSVQFQVLADGVLKAQSAVLRPGLAERLRVPIAGVSQVTLRVLNGGDGYTCDHAAWGLARFLKEGAEDPFPAP
jgi:alpha-galactosidase